ncbi:ABC transporter ATP-binding protein [Sphingomonas mesophila]|uniref:ATP-binding cassette domain-containing protein n=1 Tax=Sphingomonas mesophila TaxID=2303576 RepID=UPI000E592933|nr:ABC transporter ATP-binding protein [Sphingomonas mesophila]
MTPLLNARGVGIAGRLEASNVALCGGEMVALVGPNGGGKTSLLRALAGVEEARGTVEVDGEVLSEASPNRRERLVGLLPASRELAWPIKVRDIVRLGLTDLDRIDGVLGALELTALGGRRADLLSTGELSRVLIARLLAARPRLLLLDEPLAHLDPYWVVEVQSLLAQAVRADGLAALISLHDLGQLERFTRVIAIADGAVVFDGPTETFLESREFERIFRLDAKAFGLRPGGRRSSP